MACPFFYPLSRREETSFVIPPRLPLGGFYHGECRASAVPFTPDTDLLEQKCSNGYSRHSCRQFPPDAAVDAVRFHALEKPRKVIELHYIFERDCWPAGHGLLRYSEARRCFETQHDNVIVQRQAEAYVESYLSRR